MTGREPDEPARRQNRPVPNDTHARARVAAGSFDTLSKCARRFHALLDDPVHATGSDPSLRLWSAVNDALQTIHEHAARHALTLADAVDASPEMRSALRPPASLATEEAAAFERAVAQYLGAFGDDAPLQLHPLAGQSRSRRVDAAKVFELTSTVRLLFETGTGLLLRRIHLRGASPGDDAPTSDVAAVVALGLRPDADGLLLSVEHLWTALPARTTHVRVRRDHTTVLRARVDELVGAEPVPTPGPWCVDCPELAGCDAIPSEPPTVLASRFAAVSVSSRSPTPMRSSATTSTRRDPTLGDPIRRTRGPLVLSASRIVDYQRCPRRFFLRHLVNVPVDDSARVEHDAAIRGAWVHEELRARHDDLTRHDAETVVSEHIPNDPWVLGRARTHLGLCPGPDAIYVGGEVDLRWLDRRRGVLLTGRVDALWLHRDGLLEIRDYKTGRAPRDLDIDPAALVYLLLGIAHPTSPVSVRVTYELLGDDGGRTLSLDSTPRNVSAAFDLLDTMSGAIQRERDYEATASPHACAACEFRFVCPHAQTTRDLGRDRTDA